MNTTTRTLEAVQFAATDARKALVLALADGRFAAVAKYAAQVEQAQAEMAREHHCMLVWHVNSVECIAC
jgi:hypothetical protein